MHCCAERREPDAESVAEGKPANIIAAGLVLENEAVKIAGNLPALPIAFHQACRLAPASGSRGPCRLDGIGGGAQVVLGHMGNAGCLTGSVGGKTGGTQQRAGCTHGVPADRTDLHHLRCAARPSTCRFNCVTGPQVPGIRFLEEGQHVFGAGGRPQCQVLVVGIGESAPASDGVEPGITNSWKDNAAPLCRKNVASARRDNTDTAMTRSWGT